MGDVDVKIIQSLIEDLPYAYLDSDQLIPMEKPELYLEQVNGFVDGLVYEKAGGGFHFTKPG